jgi:hypothetical protein
MSDDNLPPFSSPAVQRKKIIAAFDGGLITSDGGVMLLAQAERRLGVAERLAQVVRTDAIRTRSPIYCPTSCALASSPLPAAKRTLTISTGCAATRLSSWPAGGCPAAGPICARSELSRTGSQPCRSRANLRPPSRSASVIDRLLKNQNPLEKLQ